MKNALVNLVNISKSFDNQMVLDDLNLYIRENEFLTLLGPSGCGKTTTLRILGGFETPDKGQVIFEGRDITNLPPNKRNLNTVFQKYALFPHMTIAENIAFGLKISGKSKSYINDKIKYALKLVNLDGFENRMPDSLSGGQQQRIAIARGLMLDPDVVIADEPVSALDVSVRAQVLNLMMDLQQELGLSYVFISHDLSVVEHIADEVMVMYLGRCVEKGTKDQIFNNPRHPYTQALLSATPRLNPDDRRERIKLSGELPSPLNPPPGCAFNARCRRRFGPCTQLQPQLKDYGGQLVACFAVDQDENPQR